MGRSVESRLHNTSHTAWRNANVPDARNLAKMFSILRVIVNPRQILFDSHVNTGGCTSAAPCSNQIWAFLKMYVIEFFDEQTVSKADDADLHKTTFRIILEFHYQWAAAVILWFQTNEIVNHNEIISTFISWTYLASILTFFIGTQHHIFIDFTIPFSLAFCEWNRGKIRVSQVIRIISFIFRVAPSHGNHFLIFIVLETFWHQTNGRNVVRVFHGWIQRQNGDVVILSNQ